MEHLYLITVRWHVMPPKHEGVEAAIAPHGRWMRFSGHSWLFWTTKNSQQINDLLAAVLTGNDSQIIVRIDQSDWYGFAQPWVWNWIRSGGTSTT
jgi:hypothetical protein